jgi:hypothetical protein
MNREQLKMVEGIRVSMALDNNMAPDDLYITEDSTYYHICKDKKKCVSIEKCKE